MPPATVRNHPCARRSPSAPRAAAGAVAAWTVSDTRRASARSFETAPAAPYPCLHSTGDKTPAAVTGDSQRMKLEDAAAFAGGLPGVVAGAKWGNRTWMVGERGFAWQRPF